MRDRPFIFIPQIGAPLVYFKPRALLIYLRDQFNLQTGEIDCCVMAPLESLLREECWEAKDSVREQIRLVKKAFQWQKNGEAKLWPLEAAENAIAATAGAAEQHLLLW